MNDFDHVRPIVKSDGEDMLAQLIATAADSLVTDLDVARLRRRVRIAVARETPARGRFWGRLALLNAAAAVFVAAILVFTGAPSSPEGSHDGLSPFTMTYQEGALVFEFEDGHAVHRIVKSRHPSGGEDEQVATARGRFHVDRNGPLEPGTAVFYRIN
ncbi:MAG: hypothetical protein OEQ13_08695 [Acidobacteriota bacterium]|nr:hypothetical protein [Acidobacteriota bacterium]